MKFTCSFIYILVISKVLHIAKLEQMSSNAFYYFESVYWLGFESNKSERMERAFKTNTFFAFSLLLFNSMDHWYERSNHHILCSIMSKWRYECRKLYFEREYLAFSLNKINQWCRSSSTLVLHCRTTGQQHHRKGVSWAFHNPPKLCLEEEL